MYKILFVSFLSLLLFFSDNPVQANTANAPTQTPGDIRVNQNEPIKPPFPKLRLKKRSHGEDAVTMLADKLPEVAAWYGHSPDKLKNMMRKDKTLWADEEGQLFVVEEAPPASALANAPSTNGITTMAAASYPLEQTFLLHSNPNSKKVIYLDFDGHVTPGTSAWASGYAGGQPIVSAPWDIDGNPSVFGDGERQMIQAIWKRVAEDYAPFDVDVTTEAIPEDRITRSSSSDLYYGARAVISPTNWYSTSAGGVAYIGAFNQIGDSLKPAFIFANQLANGEKYMAEAISHEIGHNLGLYHDGSSTSEYYYGQNGWAPIMGVGYYQDMVQWSKGEYPDASNLQDDYQVMSSYGLNVSTDMEGNALSTAVSLTAVGTNITGYGIIEQPTDIDVFKFNTGSGPVSINISPAPVSPNLNIKAELRDGSGNVITIVDDPNSYGAVINQTLATGTYYIFIDGVGSGDLATGYPNYGSLGQYSITGTVAAGANVPPVAVATGTPTSGSVPLNVQFDGSGSYDTDGGIASYQWNFGDGTSSNLMSPSHQYNVSGNFSASLIVTDNTGLSNTAIVNVIPTNQPPVAMVTSSAATGVVPATISLSGSNSIDNDGTITSYAWNFGDGTTGSGVNVSHVFSKSGSFSVQLIVTDNMGAQATASTTVSISPDPTLINAPSKLSAAASGKVVTIKWTDNSSNEEGFYVERGLKGRTTTTYKRVATLIANTKQYSETVTSDTYYYRVQAFNNSTGKTSKYSNGVSIRVR